MDLLAGYGSDSESEEEIVQTKQEVKPKIQFDLPKPKSSVPLTDLALPEDIIVEDDEPYVDEKQQKALLFAQIEQEEERSFPTRKSNSTASSSSLFSQLPAPKAKESTKFSLFSSLPAPKDSKSKDEFSLPDAKRKLPADPKDESDDEEDDKKKRPFKKATIEDSPLSFLPAPKRDPSAIIEDQRKENEKKIRAIEKPTIPTPSITEQQQQQPVKIVPKEESEQDKIKKEKQQQLQRQKSQQKQQFFRNLVSNSVTTPVPAQKQDVETPLPEAEPEMQPQQEYVDPMYTGGINFAYVDPATMNAREGRAFNQGNVNIMDVNMNQLKQGWSKAGYSEPIVTPMPVMVDGGKVMPSRDAKRQGHISHLVWDLNRKLPELEAKRSDSAKKKMESKMKYGF